MIYKKVCWKVYSSVPVICGIGNKEHNKKKQQAELIIKIDLRGH